MSAEITEQKITASDAAERDLFGSSVSISGDSAIIGAWGNSDGGHYSGSAYVFRYDPATQMWIEEQKLTASDPGADDQFGYSLSLSGAFIETTRASMNGAQVEIEATAVLPPADQ